MTEGVTELLRVGILQPSLGHPHAEEQAVEKGSGQSFCRTSPRLSSSGISIAGGTIEHHHQSDSSTPPAVLSA
jgi:hypothetical protein